MVLVDPAWRTGLRRISLHSAAPRQYSVATCDRLAPKSAFAACAGERHGPAEFLRVRPNSLSQISMGYNRRGTEIFVELGALAFHPGILRM